MKEKYDSYKDSGIEWIGEIPKHWDKVKMKFLGKIGSGDGLESSLIDKNEGVFPVYGGNGIMGYYSKYNFNKPILVIGRVGEKCGNVHYSDKEVYVNDNSLVFDSYDDRMDLWFVYHSLVQRDLNQLRNKNTQPLITGTIVKDESIPCPPINEQQQIVQFLDTKTYLIDSLIKKTKKKIKLLKEQRTSLINKIVTKGLNPNIELKDSGVEWIGEIPSHWENRNGSTIGLYSKGKGIKKDEVKEVGNLCIRYGEIYTKYNHLIKEINTFIDDNTIETSVSINSDSLLLTGSGETKEEIGKCVVYTGSDTIWIGGDIIILKPNNNVNSVFLSYLINSECIRVQREMNGKGEIIVHIYSKNFKEMRYPIPPLNEQKQIVDYLDKKTNLIDSTISIEEKRIETLKEYRQSLISEVVTGKIKVTN